MKWRITFLTRLDLLWVKISGRTDAKSFKSMMTAMSAHLAEHIDARVLMDYRHAEPSMRVFDIYESPRIASDVGIGHGNRIAVLFPPSDAKEANYKFLEDVGQNAGYALLVFTNPKGAAEWLSEFGERIRPDVIGG